MLGKKAKIAIFTILFVFVIVSIFILPFIGKAEAQISYNNNYASTPYEIKNQIPIAVEKDTNWQVEWYETYDGLTHREYIIAIQNQKDTESIFDLSVLFGNLNFDASQVRNVEIFELENIPKEITEYSNICLPYNTTSYYLTNDTQETVYYFPYFENCTDIASGSHLKWNLEWRKVKNTIIQEETSSIKKENYGEVNIEGKQSEKGLRYLKLSFDVPIIHSSNGFGSSGKVAFFEETSEKEYHPYWYNNYTYVRSGTINITATAPVKNITFRVNGSQGWYNNVIWCRDSIPASTVNGSYFFYENSSTDYRYVNASDNKELPCETEKGNALNRTNGQGGLFDTSVVKGMYFLTSGGNGQFRQWQPSDKIWWD